MIRTENLVFFREKHILKNISLNIPESEFTILIGPNGAGKTTLLKVFAGIIRDYEGDVFIRNKNIKNMKKKELARQVSFQPQSEEFLLPISVKDVLLAGRYPYKKIFSDYDRRDMDLYENCIEKFDLGSIITQDINTLSSGERRRVLLASAWIQDVPALLFDEPFSNLDPEGVSELMKVFLDLKREKKTVVVVTHNLEPLYSITDHLVAMREGEILYSGDKSSTISVLNRTFNMDFQMIRHNEKEIFVPHE